MKKQSLSAEIPHFNPVPRQVRQENGWTPARQRKFIEALAETASVRQAALAVNMSKVSCYQLRNHPQGGDFKRAWDAAVDAGVAFLKDIAFERAVEGELEQVWVRGEMKGYKRKFSNSLLMFLLRQYGQDNEGKRVTVNYVRTKAAVSEREVHSSQSVRIEPGRDADPSDTQMEYAALSFFYLRSFVTFLCDKKFHTKTQSHEEGYKNYIKPSRPDPKHTKPASET